jgi:hypothetical protein
MSESYLGVRRLFYRVGQGKAEKRDAFGVAFMLQDFPRKMWRASVSKICYNTCLRRMQAMQECLLWAAELCC